MLTRRAKTLTGVLLCGMFMACSTQPNTLGPVNDPTAGPDLAAQKVSIARAIEAERRHSASVYESLIASWNARGGRRTGLMADVGTSDSAETFIACAPLPFDAASRTVDAAGGEFDFGPHHLSVPAGAVSEPVELGVMVTTSLKTEVVLLPHGIQFAAPVRLTLAYSHCDAASTHRVAYVDEDGNVLEWTASEDSAELSRIVASLDHFSLYAIAY